MSTPSEHHVTSTDDPVTQGSPEPLQPRRKSRVPLWLGATLLVTASVGLVIHGSKNHISNSGKGHPEKSGPIPVIVLPATTADFPIYLDGLGTVQAYNSVQVNARVSGQIEEIRFQEGEEVKKGDVIAVIDPRTYQAQYDQAVAKKMQDAAQLQNAQGVLERDQQLMNKNILDKQTLETQKYQVAQLEAAVRADEANVELQKTQLDYTQVTAPISGRTGVRQLDVGNLVNATGNSAIVTINQIQPIYVSFTLPQQNLTQIREPLLQKKSLPVTALDRNNRTVLSTGTLSVLDNQIDTATATIRLKATFSNQDYTLWPGQFVNVRLLVGERPSSVVVPSESVQLGPEGSYVYVVGEERKATMRPVVAGPSEGGMTLIESGLKSGEVVVTDGQYRLQPGSPVQTSAPKSPAASTRQSGRNSP